MMTARQLHLHTAWLSLLVSIVVGTGFSSCNLFIEDELEEEEAKVPVHTGKGYDEPLQELGANYEITYQFNSNVRQLDDATQNYIRKVEINATGLVASIDFDLNTPAELLPVAGEIVLSGATEKFPRGIGHRVMGGAELDGVYKVIAVRAEMEEIFKVIDLDADIGGMLIEQGLAEEAAPSGSDDSRAVRERFESLADRPYRPTSPTEGESRGTTRLDIDYSNEKKIHRRVPISFKKELKKEAQYSNSSDVVDVKISGLIETIKDADNYLDVTLGLRAKMVKTESGGVEVPFGIYATCDYDYVGNIAATGSANLDVTLVDIGDFLPDEAIINIADLVILKVCCGYKVNVELNYNLEFDFAARLKGRTVADWDLLDMAFTMGSTGSALSPYTLTKVREWLKQWSVDTRNSYIHLSDCAFTGAFTPKITVSPGLGLYTEQFSARVLLAAKYEMTASLLKAADMGHGLSFENNEGISGMLDFGIGFGLSRATDVRSVINDVLKKVASAQKAIGLAYAICFLYDDDNPDAYNDYVNNVYELSDMISSLSFNDVEEGKQELVLGIFYLRGDEVEEKKSFLSKLDFRHYWLPFMDDNSWEAYPNKNGMMEMKYRIKDKGTLACFSEFTPCLLVTDEYKQFERMFFCNGTLIDNDYKLVEQSGKYDVRYRINIDDLGEDRKLLAYPGYYRGDASQLTENDRSLMERGYSSGVPWSGFFFGKPHSFNTNIPSKTRINWIKNNWVNKSDTYGKYCVKRNFTVQYELDSPSKAKIGKHGVEFVKTDEYTGPLSQVYGNYPVGNTNYVYEVNFTQDCQESDCSLEVFPFATNEDGSQKGFTLYGEGFDGIFQDGCTMVNDGDGKWSQVWE